MLYSRPEGNICSSPLIDKRTADVDAGCYFGHLDAAYDTNTASIDRVRFIGGPPRQRKRRRFSRHQGQSWPKTPPQNSEWFGIPLDQRSCEKSRFCWTSVSYSPVAMTHDTRASLADHSPSMFGMLATGQWK